MIAARPQNSGSVLVVVLWACLGLVAITVTFGHSMLMTYRGTDNDLSGRQADQAIEGAARYAEKLLANATTPGVFPELTSYEREAVPVGEATFWFLGRPLDAGNGSTREYGLVDEAGKLNLNTATAEMLKQLPGMTDDFATAIVEWRTASTSTSGTGSSSSSTVKQGPFESIEELALVAGATREILYGEDENMSGALDTNEDDNDKSLPADNGDGKLDPGILEYVTVFSREPNTQADETPRINVAAQPMPAELTTLLTEKFGAARAQEISQAIAGPPVRSVLEFYVRSGMKEDEFGQIVDAISAGTGTYLTGLINVNTASETVLACIPGIGTNNASSLVAARLSRITQDTNIAWVVPIIGVQAVPQVGPLITGASWQVSADVAAVGRHGRGWRRTRFVIDQSTRTPRIIYRRNLGGLGWALDSDVRETLAQQKEVR